MKFKFFKKVFIALVLSLSCLVNSANAGLITIGALTSNDDGSTNVISDTRNNREWLRWDELAHLTYLETLVQTTSLVGPYSDWTIAGAEEATEFLNALYNGADHGCADNDTSEIFCKDNLGFSSAEYTALLGDSSTRGVSSADTVWFYDDAWVFDGVDVVTNGKASFLNLTSGGSNRKYNSSHTIVETDTYAHTSDASIGWLMFRQSAVPAIVSEPSTLVIFAIGLMGLLSRRFKKKS